MQTAAYLILLLSILVSFAAAFLTLFEPTQTLEMWPWNTSLVRRANRELLGRHDCVDWFSSYIPTLEFLIEAAITGDSFFSCGLSTDTPMLAWCLTIFFYSLSGLLLLNMLIAMSKSKWW